MPLPSPLIPLTVEQTSPAQPPALAFTGSHKRGRIASKRMPTSFSSLRPLMLTSFAFLTIFVKPRSCPLTLTLSQRERGQRRQTSRRGERTEKTNLRTGREILVSQRDSIGYPNSLPTGREERKGDSPGGETRREFLPNRSYLMHDSPSGKDSPFRMPPPPPPLKDSRAAPRRHPPLEMIEQMYYYGWDYGGLFP